MHGVGRTPARRFRLPVSGLSVTLSPLTGEEEVLLAEGSVSDPMLALDLVRRIAFVEPSPDAGEVDWAALTVADIDAILMRLRQLMLGGTVSANLHCHAEGCGERVEFSFPVDAYLAHHAPGPARGRGWRAEADDEPGWFRLDAVGQQARFRLPTLADQIAADAAPDGEAWLAQACIAPAGLTARAQARVQEAMEMLAPPLAGPLDGACPECGARLQAQFEARRFCLQELRDRAHFVYDDIDVLAERYHWSEQSILALPRLRRAQYAERARQAARAT
jgi:hypothetical protein